MTSTLECSREPRVVSAARVHLVVKRILCEVTIERPS